MLFIITRRTIILWLLSIIFFADDCARYGSRRRNRKIHGVLDAGYQTVRRRA